jgi:putative endonuclease
VREHRECRDATSFTATYHVHKLVYVEYFQYINDAIKREKQIKEMTRTQKLALIRAHNPTLRDLMPPVRDVLPPRRPPAQPRDGWRWR